MTKLPYLRTMFATCMVFQVIYVACVLLWFVRRYDRDMTDLLAAAQGCRLVLLGSAAPVPVAIVPFSLNIWPIAAA